MHRNTGESTDPMLSQNADDLYSTGIQLICCTAHSSTTFSHCHPQRIPESHGTLYQIWHLSGHTTLSPLVIGSPSIPAYVCEGLSTGILPSPMLPPVSVIAS